MIPTTPKCPSLLASVENRHFGNLDRLEIISYLAVSLVKDTKSQIVLIFDALRSFIESSQKRVHI